MDMAAIPTQREYETPVRGAHGRATLPGSPLAPGYARALLRTAFADVPEASARLVDDAMAVVSELVTNAVVHAGTEVEVDWRLEESGAFVVEVRDHHPARAPRDPSGGEAPYEISDHGRGLRLVATLAESWGVTYRTGAKTVWARLPPGGRDEPDGPAPVLALETAEALAPQPQRPGTDRDWLGRGALSFLAEASDLLAGQLDENLVAALTGQLIVPRLADWCAVWLEDEASVRGGDGGAPARVWHASENRIEELTRALEKDPPPRDGLRSGPEP